MHLTARVAVAHVDCVIARRRIGRRLDLHEALPGSDDGGGEFVAFFVEDRRAHVRLRSNDLQFERVADGDVLEH